MRPLHLAARPECQDKRTHLDGTTPLGSRRKHGREEMSLSGQHPPALPGGLSFPLHTLG